MKCLKCQRPVEAHEQWTEENIKAHNVSPKCIGQFIGHDPLIAKN